MIQVSTSKKMTVVNFICLYKPQLLFPCSYTGSTCYLRPRVRWFCMLNPLWHALWINCCWHRSLSQVHTAIIGQFFLLVLLPWLLTGSVRPVVNDSTVFSPEYILLVQWKRWGKDGGLVVSKTMVSPCFQCVGIHAIPEGNGFVKLM